MGIRKNGRRLVGMPTSPILSGERANTGTSYQLEPIRGKGTGGFVVITRYLWRNRKGRKGRETLETSRERQPIEPGKTYTIPWHGTVEGY